MWNLWHALIGHLVLGTIHLHLKIPVLSMAYCNMFRSLGSIIVIVDRHTYFNQENLT